MENVSLLLFSLCMLMSAGTLLFTAVGSFVNKDALFKVPLLVAVGVGAVGLLASLLHLGRPLLAVSALGNLGTSMLSREVLFAAAFVGVALVACVLVMVRKKMDGLTRALLAVSAALGLAEIAFMSLSYGSTAVASWTGWELVLSTYAAAVVLGSALFLLLAKDEGACLRRALGMAALAAVAVQAAADSVWLVGLGQSPDQAARFSLAILYGLWPVMCVKWLGIVAGAGCVALPAKREGSNALLVAGAVLVLAGEVAGRYLFYASMVAPAVGLG